MEAVPQELSYDEFDLKDELADVLAENADGTIQPVETFEIKDEATLSWFTAKMEAKSARIRYYEAIKQKKLLKLQGIFQREAARIEEEFAVLAEDSKKSMTHLIAKFGQQAQAVMLTMIQTSKAKAPTKSKKYGAVQIGFRKIPIRLKVMDTEALKTWALITDAEKLLKIEETVKMAEIQAWFSDNGEIPDGTKTTGGEEEFFIKIHGDNALDILGADWLKGQNPMLPAEEPVTEESQPVEELPPV